jgi:molybdate transport system regulatory protein
MIHSRIWIENANGVHLGEGRIELLKHIKQDGSLSKAARTMKISYRKAWNLIQEMNKHSNKPLVECNSGGKGGGRTILTSHAEELIKLFEDIKVSHDAFIEQKEKEIAHLWK